MANKNFKPEKSAKAVGRFDGLFKGSVAKSRAKDSTSTLANGGPEWAQYINRTDWESPEAQTDNPYDDLD